MIGFHISLSLLHMLIPHTVNALKPNHNDLCQNVLKENGVLVKYKNYKGSKRKLHIFIVQ